MKIGKALRLFLRSNTHLTVLAVYIAALLASVILLEGAAIPAALTVAYGAGATALFFSRRGAAEIVREREEDATREASGKIAAAAEMRDTIARLRIGEKEIAGELERFLLFSGELLESSERSGRYVPLAVHEIEQVLGICRSYLTALDRLSSRSRYPGKRAPVEPADAGPVDGDPNAALKNRTLALLRAASDRMDRVNRTELNPGEELEEK